jgi:hypothetical protein
LDVLKWIGYISYFFGDLYEYLWVEYGECKNSPFERINAENEGQRINTPPAVLLL